MSASTSLPDSEKKLILPLLPSGSIAALARVSDAPSKFSVDAVGLGLPVGNAVRNPSGARIPVTLSATAVAENGISAIASTSKGTAPASDTNPFSETRT